MALNNLAALKASALTWIDHTGVAGAVNIIDDCVRLCEARVNKHPNLRLSIQEKEIVLDTNVEGKFALPGDYLAMKRVSSAAAEGSSGGFDLGFDQGFDAGSPTSYRGLLTYAEPGWWFEQLYPGGFYTIIGTTLQARTPVPLNIIYYSKVPPLAVEDPNWLLARAPDVYLYGTIMELLTALEGDAMQKYAQLFGAALESLINSETFSRGGVLTRRASMPAY